MGNFIILPKLGQTAEDGTIAKWCKNVGDVVKKGDILFEMETDKAVLEAESFYEGILLKIYLPIGVTVPVNTTVAYIGEKGEKVPDAPPAPAAAAAESPAAQPAVTPAAAPAKSAPEKSPVSLVNNVPSTQPAAARTVPVTAAPSVPSRLFISPRAKKLAGDKGILPDRIKGSGPNGRIVERDVRDYLAKHNYDQIRISPSARVLAAREKIDILTLRGTGEGGRIRTQDVERALAERPKKFSKMRQVIARRLTESKSTIPHFYVTVGVDMTDILKLRVQLKAAGVNLSVNDFVLESVALSLVEFPAVNSHTDGENVWWHGSVDIGMAVSVPDGLVVPVIRGAHELSLTELHDTAGSLAVKAREGKLKPDEMTGSTFSVSNMGMLNVDNFHAIINPGESAILAVASTRETPVVRDGKVVIRSVMNITLSADHRLVDGALAAAFVNSIRSKLEDVALWTRLTS